jgi:D-glycero-D-manno-heptose 1,7-bisphosphate phosphatase
MLRVAGRGGSTGTTPGRPALFLDRDGTLIPHRRDHVLRPEHVVPLPGVMDALATLRRLPVTIAITSNQSAVGRGLLDTDEALALHGMVLDHVHDAGGRIDASYICPHAPGDGCPCRKPRLGLFRAAVEAHDPDMARSAVVGDTVGDVLAALELGVTPALVLTGAGRDAAGELASRGLLERCRVYPSVVEVARDVVAHGAVPPP